MPELEDIYNEFLRFKTQVIEQGEKFYTNYFDAVVVSLDKLQARIENLEQKLE